MGGEKDGLDPATGEPVKGTFTILKDTFEYLLVMNSDPEGGAVFGEQVVEEWEDLSSRLHLGSKLEERASALAFVVKQCLMLLDPGLTAGNPGHMLTIKRILGILRHVCMDDTTGYGSLHRNCFEFYGECLAAMDIFMARAVWLCSMTVTKGIGPEHSCLLAKQIHREMEQAIFCMARCWSAIRSEGGTLIVSSTTLEGKLRVLASKLDKPEDLNVEQTLVEFCRVGLDYIARLSGNILEGSHSSLVEDMCKHFEGAQVLAAGVTSLGDKTTTMQLKNLGFDTLKFTIAACRLLKVLLHDTP